MSQLCGATKRKLVQRKAAELAPYAKNSRTHSEAQIAQIAASITEFGWTNPILIDEKNGVIAGHGRLLAAQYLGHKSVPCIVLAGLTAKQRRALVIADNKLALNAGWDEALLASELQGLLDDGMDLSLLGFEEDELASLFASSNDGRTDPDEVPEPPAQQVTRPGDVWILGEHRVVCGDSLALATLEQLLGDEKADCVFTSPPYAVGLDYGETYEDTLDNLRAMLPELAKQWLGFVVRGGFAVINFGDIVNGRTAAGASEPCEYPMALEYWPPFRAAGWSLWSRRVWCKPNARVHSPWAIRSNRAASDWENVWTWKAPGKALIGRVNGESQSANGWIDTTREHGVDIGKDVHGAGMAVSLPCHMLRIHAGAGRIVLEPFLGTGTTLIAAEMTGRRCFGVEINPAYVDLTVLRWQNFTGEEATLEASGETFNALLDAAETKRAA